jgi:hypothetical protein
MRCKVDAWCHGFSGCICFLRGHSYLPGKQTDEPEIQKYGHRGQSIRVIINPNSVGVVLFAFETSTRLLSLAVVPIIDTYATHPKATVPNSVPPK